MSTNKVYGDNPNKLKFIENSKRWELPKKVNFIKVLMKTYRLIIALIVFLGCLKLMLI